MDDDAPLERIDRRLTLTDAHLREIRDHVRQGNEYIQQGNAYMQDARAASERHAQGLEDQRLALNQMNLRSERIMQGMLAELRDLRQGTQEMTSSIREWRHEGVEEARAQRAALWAILDELKGRGPATA